MILTHMYALWLGGGLLLFIAAWILTASVEGQNTQLAVRTLIAAAIFGFGGVGAHSAAVIVPAFLFLTPDAGFVGILTILLWWAVFSAVAFSIRGVARSVGIPALSAATYREVRRRVSAALDKINASPSSARFWKGISGGALVAVLAVWGWGWGWRSPPEPRAPSNDIPIQRPATLLSPAEITVIAPSSSAISAQSEGEDVESDSKAALP